MKRIHIHIAVEELAENINFYSTIFGATPTIERKDYAKWQLDDPAVNFAISIHDHTGGLNHLGIQVDSAEELQELSQRFDKAEIDYTSQEETSCCYAYSNKHWVTDPQGNAWESFHTLDDAPVFGDDKSIPCCVPLYSEPAENNNSACCVPNENDTSSCCA